MTDQAQTTPPAQPRATAAPLSGIGGWLLLPLLGLVLTVVNQLPNLQPMAEGLGSVGNLDALTSNIVVIDIILTVVILLIAPLVLLGLMLSKSRRFPRLYIVWLIVSAVFVVADLFVSYSLIHSSLEASGTSFFDLSTLRTLLGPLIGVCVWIPYMLNSVRVKNTFVK